MIFRIKTVCERLSSAVDGGGLKNVCLCSFVLAPRCFLTLQSSEQPSFSNLHQLQSCRMRVSLQDLFCGWAHEVISVNLFELGKLIEIHVEKLLAFER